MIKGWWVVARPFEGFRPGSRVDLLDQISNPREIDEHRFTVRAESGETRVFEMYGAHLIRDGFVSWEPPEIPDRFAPVVRAALVVWWRHPFTEECAELERLAPALPCDALRYVLTRPEPPLALVRVIERAGPPGLTCVEQLYADDSQLRGAPWLKRILLHRGSATLLPELFAALGSPVAMQRRRACDDLGELGRAEARPHLEAAMRDANWNVRDAARGALAKLRSRAARR